MPVQKVQKPLPKHKAISFLSSFSRNWYFFQTQLHHLQPFCYAVTISEKTFVVAFLSLTLDYTLSIFLRKKELMTMWDITMMMRKKWDFSAILHANNTKMFTNILKINQVFKFGSHYNPQGQSASLWNVLITRQVTHQKTVWYWLAYGRK